jgi:multicomponent Na+:H+ antiporter subunit A
MVFLVVHSLYKGALFMVAGAIDHETGNRFITGLGGLRGAMPITALAAALAALSMAGFPLFLGFIGKELIYEATLETDLAAVILTTAAVIANILTIIAAGLVAIRPFWGRQLETPKHPHEAPPGMWLGPATMAGLGLLLGLFSSDLSQTFFLFHFDESIISPAISAILAEPVEIHLHLFAGAFNTVVLLSAVTIAGGFGLYFSRDMLYRRLNPLNIVAKWGPEQWYQWLLDGLMVVARYQTRTLQSGYLRYYLLTIIATTVLLAGYTLFTQITISAATIFRPASFTVYELLIYLTILAATVMTMVTTSRLAAVAALGVVGYGVALIFIFFGAPDLAMTQLSIETLSVILLVLVLYKLPRFATFSGAPHKIRDMIAALISGGLMTLLVLVVTALPAQSRLTPYFAENSLTLAKGHNVVNVILVDFRGFDTMGEITVLGVAAIGVYGLLKLRLEQQRRQAKQRVPKETATDIFPTLQQEPSYEVNKQ